MLVEGVPAAMIENVGRMAGMPVGPLSLNDEVAVDLAWKILQGDRGRSRRRGGRSAPEGAARGDGGEARPPRPQERQGLLRLPARAGRRGCGRASPSCSRRSSIPTRIDIEELKQRLLASRRWRPRAASRRACITDVREADVGSILGFGFAPFTGGTLSYIDMMGTKAFVESVPAAGEGIGAALRAAASCCVDMAAKGETFYGRFASGRASARRRRLTWELSVRTRQGDIRRSPAGDRRRGGRFGRRSSPQTRRPAEDRSRWKRGYQDGNVA